MQVFNFFFQNLTDANDLLQNEVNKLKYQLEEATQQMDRTAEDYAKLKVVRFLNLNHCHAKQGTKIPLIHS